MRDPVVLSSTKSTGEPGDHVLANLSLANCATIGGMADDDWYKPTACRRRHDSRSQANISGRNSILMTARIAS